MKIGDEVAWVVRGTEHRGIVREVVERGQRPTIYRDSYGVPSSAMRRRFVVEENGKLFYPAANSFAQAEQPGPKETEG